MIVGLNDKVVSTIATAGVLMSYMRGVISDFEQQTIGEVCRRFVALGPETSITEDEWRVFCDATRVMAEKSTPAWEFAYRFDEWGHGHPSVVRYAGRA